jgi:hypothetical protein
MQVKTPIKMKKREQYYRIILLFLAAILLQNAGVLAQQYEKSKTLTRAFYASNETSVQIMNKYGNIHLLPWDKDSVRVEVNIKVEANKQSKVEKTFDNIEIEFSESPYYLIVQTVLGNQKNSFWADVTDFTNSMLKGGSIAQIDYSIYIPENVELTVENKFGNIYMTDHKGKTMINLSNGDFRGGRINTLELDHGFGTVVIDSVNTATLTLSYTELKLNYGKDLRVTSKSSKPNIKHFASIRINSRRDTYFFEKAGTVNGETSFSYLTIQTLEGDLILNTNYGNLNVDGFGRAFSMMNLAARYTDISMICDQGFDYFLEVYHDDKTRMMYPKSPPIFMLEESGSEDNKFLLSGHAGSNAEEIPRMKINIEGGSVNIIHQ